VTTLALGDTFVDKSGAPVKLSDITAAGKNIGLYFSAHWCGPCRQFTPQLVKMYEKLTGWGCTAVELQLTHNSLKGAW
jgi:nucleoredoxin